MTKTIAVTGGICSGKSTVSKWLAKEIEGAYISADLVAKEIFEANKPALQGLREVIGDEYFNDDGVLNRPLLRSSIFEDAHLRKSVDIYSHPLILREIQRKASMDNVEGVPQQAIIVEVPLLFEAGWELYFEKSIVVYTSSQRCLSRLMQRDMLSRQEAQTAISAQISLFEKAMWADHVIDNSGEWFSSLLQIRHLAAILQRNCLT